MLLFCSCVTNGYNTATNDDNKTETNQQNTPNNSKRSKKIGSTIAYVLEEGESLRTLILTQNDLNEYGKHENEPTDIFYKEMFSEYEKKIKEDINELDELNELIKEATEEDKKEFQKIFNISINEFADIFKKIGFFYKIEYNKNTKEWHIELIGRSTTLKMSFASTSLEGMSYYHRVSSHIRSWMDLNNVKDLDAVFRIYINDIDNDVIPEIFGIRRMIGNHVDK